MNKTLYTLITGASAGLGKSLALECARRGMNLVLVALPGAELPALAAFIKLNYDVEVVSIEKDLCNDGACTDVFHQVKAANLHLNMLINNAGLGSTVLFDEGQVALYEQQIKLNVLATTLMTRLFLQELKDNCPAYILNVGSLASFFTLRKKMVYSATKSFVYDFTRSLRRELKSDHIYVSLLCPGGMNTNLDMILMLKKAGYFSRLAVMNPEDAAPIAMQGLLHKKAVIIPGRINQCFLLMAKILPGFIQTIILNNSINTFQATKPISQNPASSFDEAGLRQVA